MNTLTRAAVVFICLAQVASADLILELQPNGVNPSPGPTPNSDGNIVNQLNVTFDSLIGGQQLLIELTLGSIVGTTHANAPKPPSTLPNDTLSFIALGNNSNIFTVGGSTSLGGATDLTFEPTLVDVTWAPGPPVPATGGPGYLVSQIVLTPDAVGTWSYLGTTEDGNHALVHTLPALGVNPIGFGVINSGVMTVSAVPEPSALAFGLVVSALVGVVKCGKARRSRCAATART